MQIAKKATKVVFSTNFQPAKKKTFYLHKLIRSAADEAEDAEEAEEEEGGDREECFGQAALCIENIRRRGLKYVIPKISIPPNAMEKHVLLLGKTGCGKSLAGCVLVENYGSGSFHVSSSTRGSIQYTSESE